MKLYISFLSVMVLALLYVPLAVGVIRRVVRRSGYRGMRAAALALACLTVAAAIPLGDVVVHSWNMAKACQRAGLHIYKKVQVEGYYDPSGDPKTFERSQYRFFETGRNKVWRYVRQGDGGVMRSEIPAATANFEINYEDHVPDSVLGVNRSRWWAKDRVTGEVVGEYLGFSPYYGWVDRYLVQRWFGTIGGNTCRGDEKLLLNWRTLLLPPKQ